MTDAKDTSAMMPNWSTIMAGYAAQEALTAALVAPNKIAIFDALAAADITVVTVAFDGYGDSGQIEDVSAVRGEDTVSLPVIDIVQQRPRADGSGADPEPCALADAIETLTYDLLQQTHAGWENIDGAYGEFRFDVATRAVTLDHHDR